VRTKESRLFAAAVFYLLSVFALYLLFNLNRGVRYVSLDSNSAVFDLSDFDFDTSVAFADGKEHYYNKLVTPDKISGYAPDTYGNGVVKQTDYMTTRVRFIVPDGDYMIFGKTPEYASRIYVNGELKVSSGRIDAEKGNIYRIDTFEIATHPANGVIEVITHSAAIIREDAAVYPVFLGEYQTAQSVLLSVYIQNLILLGLILSGALFFFGFYIFMPHVRANFWFALCSAVIAFRMAITEKWIFRFFPRIDYRFIFAAENGTLILLSTFYLLLIRALFTDGIPKLFIKIVFALNALLTALLLCLPVRIAAGFLWVHAAVLITVAAVSAACILRVIKRANEEQIISFAGQALFLYFGIADMLLTRGIHIFPALRVSPSAYGNVSLSAAGMSLFLLAQMVALFLHNNKAAENGRRLAAENASLEKLNSMKTKMLGNMSHELKTPLTVISNMAQLAARHTSDGYVRDKMDAVVKEINRLKEKSRQILKMSRLEEAGTRLDFVPVDLRIMIPDTVSAYYHALDEHNNTMSVEITEDLPPVTADPAYLPGVIVNLIDNAIRFTRNGKITVKALRDGNRAVVSVEDTGCGIAPEAAKHIFERFYTGEKFNGTGLGLYICKKTVEAHGGDIRVKSEPGKGTAVSFTLRLYKEDFP